MIKQSRANQIAEEERRKRKLERRKRKQAERQIARRPVKQLSNKVDLTQPIEL